MRTEDAGEFDAAAEESDAGESDAGELVSDCPLSTTSCSASASEFLAFDTLLVASDYGAGAKFVAIQGSMVLVELADASRKLVRLVPESSPVEWTLPAGFRAEHAADRSGADAVYVLASSQENADELTLLRGDQNEASLAVVAGATLPAAQVRGLVVDAEIEGARPCVYGTGLACFDGAAWQQLIPREVAIVGADLAWSWGLAVAQDGTLWVAKRKSDEKHALFAFQALEHKAPGTLRSISAGIDTSSGTEFERASIVTSEGLWRVSRKGQLASCTDLQDLGALLAPDTNEVALYADGRYLSNHDYGAWCQVEKLALDGEVIGYASSPCGPAVNPRVLTETKLIGQNVCVLLGP